MRTLLLIALTLTLFLVSPAYAITIQQNVTFNTSATNTTYIAGANFTVDAITITPTLLNISNSSGDFVMSAIAQSPVNITILEFDSIHKKFTISNTSGNAVSLTVGNLPISTQIEVKKGSSSWTTVASNSSGYAAFTYSGYSDAQFEILQYSAPSNTPVNNNVGTSGGGSTWFTQNKTNQTTKNITIIVPTTTNVTTPQEPEIRQKAEEKINEVGQKIKPEDIAAKERLSEAEAAYSSGQYDRAYSLAVDAEGLIGKGAETQGTETEKMLTMRYYLVALIVFAVVGAYLYKWAQKRGFPVYKEAKEPAKPKEKSPLVKERIALKPVKQAPNPNKDADLDDIQRRLEDIRRKIGK